MLRRALPTLVLALATACGSGTALPDASVGAQVEVRGLAPAGGPLAGGTVIVIDGHGFVDADAGDPIVLVGDRAAVDVHVADDFTISATTPGGADAGAAVDVVVANRNGFGRLAAGFRYHPRPAIASVTPAVGTSAGGTGVTIRGAGFQALDAGVNEVRFGDLEAVDVVVVSDELMTARTPPGPPFERVAVSIANRNGPAVPAPDAFRYSGHGLVFGGGRGEPTQALHFIDASTGISSTVMTFAQEPLRSDPIHALATIAPGRYWAVTRGLVELPHLVAIDLGAHTATDIGAIGRVDTGERVDCNDLDLVAGTVLCMSHTATYALDPVTARATPLPAPASALFGVATIGAASFALSAQCCGQAALASFTPTTGAVGAPTLIALTTGGFAPPLGKLSDFDGDLYAIDARNGIGIEGPGVPGGGGFRSLYRIDAQSATATFVTSLPVRTMALTRSE
ncbi:MAG: IPT/TIG domain-containing protein [Deltaproteobacteria bacterium]|nr:IPT/TIG domain-containing protein [Deltaproteobacteria bacterium]